MCMHTYTRMLNSCIISGEEVNELVSYPNDSNVLRNNNTICGNWVCLMTKEKSFLLVIS